MVFQDFALWPHMKARDNILYGLKVRRVDKDEQEKRLQKVVSLLHLVLYALKDFLIKRFGSLLEHTT